ncbi:hypothetical protein K227x_10240 [Rubripirellula lacrimiformis]|uniref:DUF58 domain-containing protein n=2 Tax=Rubripirellula lacrimiformis TaxID=1930273 RepID=A0A517N679_9BACT|nr:hypothetical protein K227x_10240 [Rubripirellula lacrimiformis]
MDWKATARLRKPHVRVYSGERERPVLMVVDQRTPMFFGSQRVMKSVAAAEVAALSAWRAQDGGDRVGGLVFNESGITEVRPQRGRSGVLRLLHQTVQLNHQLADVPITRVPITRVPITRVPTAGANQRSRTSQASAVLPSPDTARTSNTAPSPDTDQPPTKVGLNDVLEHVVRIAKHDHLVVVISDLDGADSQTQKLATNLSAHNDVLIIAVYDPLGYSLSGSPGMVASDRGRTWHIPESGGFPQHFEDTFQRRLDHWKTIFQSLRVPVLPLSTHLPAAEQIRNLLGHRPG